MVLGSVIARAHYLRAIRTGLRRSRVVALVGPRQSGKTTLARQILPASSSRYFDLEDPVSLERLDEPLTALSRLRGTVVIDEVQRRPELFPVLRVLSDRVPLPARFLVLGSAAPDLLHQASESLAGRVETIELGGLSLQEVGGESLERHWLRGGFPLSFLARSDADASSWRKHFVQTFLERDVAAFGMRLPATTLRRFWAMVAHSHGGVWNSADPARSLGISEPTVRRYLDLLTGLFMVRQLPPWHENLAKRQVKSPKVYVRDSGLLHELLGIRSEADLAGHPKAGASWEGYAIEEVLRVAQADEAYFWATHQGAELDLLLMKDGRRYGVEVKRADAPRLTPSMRIAMADLRLERLTVLYPGETSYSLGERVTAEPLVRVASGDASALFGGRRGRRG